MTFIQYLDFLTKKYQVTTSEILDQFHRNGFTMTKHNLAHKLSGDRDINEVELATIIETLCLSPQEATQLHNLYRQYQFGEDAYTEVALIKRYIEHFPDKRMMRMTSTPIDLNARTELNGAQAIRETLFALLSEAWGKQEIFIYCQPEFDDLIHALLTLCGQGSSNVSQIISLNNDCKTDHNLYNIHCLKMLDRLIVHNSSHIVHYYYDQVNAHIHGLKIFPYFIIAGEHLLLLSHNFKMAFLSHDIILLRTMRAEFHRIFERTLPLFEVIPNDIAYMQACMQIEESTRSDFYTLQYHPCVIFNYDEALTRSYIRMDTPYGDLMLQAIRTRWQSLEHITGHHFHTPAGTEEFLNTGITTDMTPKLFRPLSKEDRQRALDAILNVPSHKHFEVNEDFLQIPQKLMIACFDSGQVMLSYQGENNNRLVLKERSLYHSIRNFFRYLEQYESRQMHSCVM